MNIRSKREKVRRMIDYRSTHTYIPKKVISTLQISMDKTSNYGVIVGTKNTMKGKGVCEATKWLVNEWKTVGSLLPQVLGEVDIVWRAQLMYSLGIIEMEWRSLAMTVYSGKNIIEIRRDPCSTKTRVNLKNMMKFGSYLNQGYLIGGRVLDGEIIIAEFRGVDVVPTTRVLPAKATIRTVSHVFQLK